MTARNGSLGVLGDRGAGSNKGGEKRGISGVRDPFHPYHIYLLGQWVLGMKSE